MRSCDSKKICELCGREISTINFSKHLRRHENHPETFISSKYALNHDGLICQFCGKECKNRNSLCNHERLCRENPDRQVHEIVGFNNIGRVAWNKGLTKETNDSIKRQAQTLSKTIKGKPGHKHTENEKQKISESMKAYLAAHPDRVPYLLNHSSTESFPETYFKELFKAEHMILVYHYQLNKYELDFCDPNKKVDIEIDGEQHYVDPRIKKSDIDRTVYLESLGWTIYRIRWANYQKLDLVGKSKIIYEIKQLLVN